MFEFVEIVKYHCLTPWTALLSKTTSGENKPALARLTTPLRLVYVELLLRVRPTRLILDVLEITSCRLLWALLSLSLPWMLSGTSKVRWGTLVSAEGLPEDTAMTRSRLARQRASVPVARHPAPNNAAPPQPPATPPAPSVALRCGECVQPHAPEPHMISHIKQERPRHVARQNPRR